MKTDPEIVIKQLEEKNYSQASTVMKFENQANMYKWFIEDNGLEDKYNAWRIRNR